jgi:hypothetical protein
MYLPIRIHSGLGVNKELSVTYLELSSLPLAMLSVQRVAGWWLLHSCPPSSWRYVTPLHLPLDGQQLWEQSYIFLLSCFLGPGVSSLLIVGPQSWATQGNGAAKTAFSERVKGGWYTLTSSRVLHSEIPHQERPAILVSLQLFPGRVAGAVPWGKNATKPLFICLFVNSLLGKKSVAEEKKISSDCDPWQLCCMRELLLPGPRMMLWVLLMWDVLQGPRPHLMSIFIKMQNFWVGYITHEIHEQVQSELCGMFSQVFDSEFLWWDFEQVSSA